MTPKSWGLVISGCVRWRLGLRVSLHKPLIRPLLSAWYLIPPLAKPFRGLRYELACSSLVYSSVGPEVISFLSSSIVVRVKMSIHWNEGRIYLYIFFSLLFWCDFGEKVSERSFFTILTEVWSNFWLQIIFLSTF